MLDAEEMSMLTSVASRGFASRSSDNGDFRSIYLRIWSRAPAGYPLWYGFAWPWPWDTRSQHEAVLLAIHLPFLSTLSTYTLLKTDIEAENRRCAVDLLSEIGHLQRRCLGKSHIGPCEMAVSM